MGWWQRIFGLLSRKRSARDHEKDGELPRHVDLWMRELIDEGMDPRAAREEALHCFGERKDSAGPPDYPPICMKLSRLP